MKTVILTGAFGNVGQWVLKELVEQEFEVIALEIKNDRTMGKQSELLNSYNFNTEWVDLTDRKSTFDLISKIKPDAIAHVAAVIAPTAYVIPKIAYNVNVNGSENLIEAVSNVTNFKRFVFVSSYSVHGSQNPHKSLKPLTGKSPVKPGDNYGKHKIIIEQKLEQSTLDWTIIRLPAVLSHDSDFGGKPEFQKFSFLLDPNRYQSAIDARDAGLAIANAISADCSKSKFTICGDPSKGWVGKAIDITGGLLKALGVNPPPEKAYRLSDPKIDDSWYYEGIVDPSEAQRILKFQRYSMEDYLNEIKIGFGRKVFMKLISPLIKRTMLKYSPYYKLDSNRDSRPIWESIKKIFEIKDDQLQPLER